MPEIFNEYIDTEICTHHFVIDCCDYFVEIYYNLDWRELNSISPNEVLGLYRCPISTRLLMLGLK